MSTVLGCDGGSSTDELDNLLPVLTGQFEDIPESRGIFVWGNPRNELCQQWSLAIRNQSGWFYGTNVPWSSADVYVLNAPDDPLSVVAAENFRYSAGSVQAREGDTVFFRGRNGYFGAWTITAVEGNGRAVLSGQWYFKTGGGGDFTSAIVDGGTSIYDPTKGVCDGY